MAYSLDGISRYSASCTTGRSDTEWRKSEAETPFRRPTSFKLSLNIKASREIGVTIPPILIATADEVIE